VVWVFFATENHQYSLECPHDSPYSATAPIEALNNHAPQARRTHDRPDAPRRAPGDTGFLTSVQLDLNNNGFDNADEIASGPAARGSFADVLDEAGVDSSKATVIRTTLERGSGPLHVVLRVDGEYRYGRQDNQASPFITRIHAYAGRSYIRVLHTWVYWAHPTSTARKRATTRTWPRSPTASSRQTRPTRDG
jgi:hypothetical protein